MEESVEGTEFTCKQDLANGYGEILALLTTPEQSDESLYNGLVSIKGFVTLLNAEDEYLIGALLQLDWTNRGPAFCEMYESLICCLVSVHTGCLRAVLRMIIKQFRPLLPPSSDDEQGNVDQDRHTFQMLHSLMQKIVQLVPMSPKVIMPLLIDLFPFMNKHVYIQDSYVQNLFVINQYVPQLRQQILELVIDKLLKIDVQLPKDEIFRREQGSQVEEDSGVFTMEELKPNFVKPKLLDTLITRLFQFMDSTCHEQTGTLDWEATKRLYREMLFIFEKLILTTHASSHVQFVMFYLCSLRTEICDGFLDFLWKLVQNPNVQAVFRQSAASYIGSLLARGRFVTINTVMKMLEIIVLWLHSYTKISSDTVTADIRMHGPFYSVCQTVFYVFSFRQKEITNTKKGLKWAENLQFQRLVQCRLNPLKVCFPIVVKTFASITRQHQLAFCDHIIEQNKRCLLMSLSSGNQKVLESYFPFDPYLLEQSSIYIKSSYKDYDKSVLVEESDSSEDEDDYLTDENILASSIEGVAMTSSSMTEKSLMLDIMEYSISPGFSHVKPFPTYNKFAAENIGQTI